MEAKLVTGQLLGREDDASKHFQAKILLFALLFPVMLADFRFFTEYIFCERLLNY